MFNLLSLFMEGLDDRKADYDYESKEDELIVKFYVPGTPKDAISIEKFDDKVLVEFDTVPKRVNRIPLKSKLYKFGDVDAVYEYGILTVSIKKIKEKGDPVSIK